MIKFLRLSLIGLLVVGLALVRFFEHDLFSDPLLVFYKTEFSYAEAPEFNTLQVIASTSFRFLLNTILSLSIIWLAFPTKRTLLFSVVFYVFAFVILLLTFWFFIDDMKSENHLIIFYIRRFLIQPIFVLILLPAFYYQKKVSKEKEH
jgi:exosortase F-associated protein